MDIGEGMTKKMLVAVSMAATMIAACGGDDDGSKSGSSGQGAQASGLSASFQAVCAKCHGDEGRGQGIYPQIPGSKDEASFIAIVRAGRGEMPATNAARFSEADLKADFLWLTTERK
ncbi:MAG: hypothetical protein BGO98_47510 [Myxococcales bacterium 68-20]|nr:MAG: hypothetical protein BGO98_47510 [Myxococcales bacterium 68-20]